MERNTTSHRYQENEGRQAEEKVMGGGGHQAHHALMISRRSPSKSTNSYHKSKSLLQVKFPPAPAPFFFPHFRNKHGRPTLVQVPSPGLYHV